MLSRLFSIVEPVVVTDTVTAQHTQINRARSLLDSLRKKVKDEGILRYLSDKKSFLHEAEGILRVYQKALIVSMSDSRRFSSTELIFITQLYDNGVTALSLSHGTRIKDLISKQPLDVQELFSEFIESLENIVHDFKFNYGFIKNQLKK